MDLIISICSIDDGRFCSSVVSELEANFGSLFGLIVNVDQRSYRCAAEIKWQKCVERNTWYFSFFWWPILGAEWIKLSYFPIFRGKTTTTDNDEAFSRKTHRDLSLLSFSLFSIDRSIMASGPTVNRPLIRTSCEKCRKPFTPKEPMQIYQERYYHTSCFCCSVCGKSIAGQPFYPKPNQQFQCESCNNNLAPK